MEAIGRMIVGVYGLEGLGLQGFRTGGFRCLGFTAVGFHCALRMPSDFTGLGFGCFGCFGR